MQTILILCGEKPHQDPRTRFHAEFFKAKGYNVDIISYAEHSREEAKQKIYKIANVQTFPQTKKTLICLYIKKFLFTDIKKTNFLFLIFLLLLTPILLIYRPINIIKRKYSLKKNFLDYLYKILFYIKQHINLSVKLYLYDKIPYITICQEPHTLSSVTSRLLKKTIIIFDAHEISYDEEIGQDNFTKFILRKYESQLINNINYFVTVSDHVKALYIKNNSHLKNISFTIPNVNNKKHILQNDNQLDERNIKFLVSSSYFTNKGLEEFIDAWKIADPKNATLYLRIFSPDRFNKSLKNFLITLKGNYNNIKILNPVTSDKVISDATKYDIGVIFYNPNLNLNYKYCCPNKFGEYLFSGLGILSTNSCFLEQTIGNSQCGITYNPNKTENTVKTIKDIINNPSQITNFKNNAFLFSKEKFHYEIFAERLLTRINQDQQKL